MDLPQYHVDGNWIVVIRKSKPEERAQFSSNEEARARVKFIETAFTWIGTPFIDLGDVKGPKGATDCVMMLGLSSIEAGLRDPFDPRKDSGATDKLGRPTAYSPRHMISSEEELLIKYLTERLGCVEVDTPQLGDLIAFRFGKPYAHLALYINKDQVLHSHGLVKFVMISDLKEALLAKCNVRVNGRLTEIVRPRRYFDYYHTWNKI